MSSVRFRLVRGADISAWPAAAIAVSSNLTLAPNNNPHYWRFAGREGTNGAVHAAAGPELLAAVRQLPVLQDDAETAAAVGIAARSNIRCNVSRAVSTPAFGSLQCDHVIHTVCPDGMYGFERDAEDLLRETYRAVLAECSLLQCTSLAMPAIGCGVQGWRPAFTARIALEAVEAHNASPWGGVPSRVDMVFNSESAWRSFRLIAEKQLGPPLEKTAAAAAAAAAAEAGAEGHTDETAQWELRLGSAGSGSAASSSTRNSSSTSRL